MFKIAFENANIGIYLVDANGDIFKANKEMSKMIGYSIKELENKNLNNIAHPDYKNISLNFFKQAKKGKKFHTVFEKHYLHKDGHEIICLVSSSTIEKEDTNSMYFISYVQEITEKRKTEIKLLKKNEDLIKAKDLAEKKEIELKELNATKDRLFSIIAHDLITPFNSILGFSEILLESEDDIGLKESKELLSIINSSAKHTLTLLNNLLNWEKSQTGQIVYYPEIINLPETIKKIVDISNSTFKYKNISLKIIQSDEIKIYTDKNMVETVLRNLISNAIKFTNLNGTIKIITILKLDFVEITISDNGVGMDEQTCQNLFDISTNSTSRGTENEKGSGLGLVLCKEFVEKLGGKIWVKSSLGEGSDFKFILPIKKI